MARDTALLHEALGFLGDSMVGGTDYAAERAGRDKQRQAAAAMKLPIRMDPGDREVYEALGFKFGKPLDKHFMEVEFPLGWGTKPTDHYMYTLIVDDRGRRRGQYMYKSDFWDVDAALWAAERRFRVQKDYDTRGMPNRGQRDEVVYCVLDQSREIYRTEVYVCEPLEGEKQWEAGERVEMAAIADAVLWLRARFPEHENPLAYWSLPDEIDYVAFPEGYLFAVQGRFVGATHVPSGISHSFEFSENGNLLPSGRGEKGSAPRLDPVLRAKAVAWAAMLANQPADPRPKKGERR